MVDGRQQRGMQIAADGQVAGNGGIWLVGSQTTKGRKYRVNLFSGSCTCPDHEDTGSRCKHVWAVTFTMTAEVAPDGTATVTQTACMTYRQEWSSYNRAQVQEKDTFMRLLADLCSGVEQPVQTNGRPRLPLSDMVFAATFKVYCRFSSRRFSSDLREAQERGLITRTPHFNSVTNYMSDGALTPILHNLVTMSSLPLKAVETDFAVDSSGFSTNRFAQWVEFKYGKTEREKRRQWLKAHVMVGVKTNVVTSVEVSAWNDADTRYFGPLVRQTAAHFPLAEVSADKAYLSRPNLALVEGLGGTAFIPFKSNTTPVQSWKGSAWARMYHYFMYNREEFMAPYHKRSNVETTFSMIKSKFGDSLMSKSETGQVNEVLCKVLAHNVVVVGQAVQELGIEPVFTSSR
jgi:transposase